MESCGCWKFDGVVGLMGGGAGAAAKDPRDVHGSKLYDSTPFIFRHCIPFTKMGRIWSKINVMVGIDKLGILANF